MNLHHTRIAGIFAALIALACSTGGGGWREAREKDTPGAYHRFLRDHPDAEQAGQARERLAFTKLRKRPTAEGYEKFRSSYPQSPLLAEIAQLVEEPLFERARARGTADAYRDFLAEFPSGRYADRAAGNLEYLEQGGFRGRPAQLADFASRHGASDFAKEAARSGVASDVRRKSEFRTVGLLVEIAQGTPGGDRVARALAERARRQLSQAGIKLVALTGASDPRRAKVGATLTIRHREEIAKPDIRDGGSAFSGVLATTHLLLERSGDPQPVWSEELNFRVSIAERKEEESILFGATGDRYWDAFYVPITTWSTQQAMRAPFAIGRPAVAVKAVDHRVFVLFEEGDFQIVDISDPAAPLVIGQYRRPRDLSKWSDLNVIGGRVAIFGGDGLEVVDLASGAPERVFAFDRTKVGTVVAVERASAGWMIAGSRGLMLLRKGAAEPQMLAEVGVVGAAMHGDRVVFTNGESLFVATLAGLQRQKAEGQLRIGKNIAPDRVRLWGNTAVVLGETDVLLVDLSKPSAPRSIARVTALEAGEIHDAMVGRGRLFVLGSRGLQVLDASGRRLADATDVSARARLDASGRHLVMVGEADLQVVDITPFVTSSGLAAPRP